MRQTPIKVPAEQSNIRVIEAIDGELITNELELSPLIKDGNVVSDTSRDILKLVVVNRYNSAPPAIGFVKGFGFTSGAIASSVAHDSHNIVAVGVDDTDIVKAVNLVIESQGGVSAVQNSKEKILPLPIAGLMTAEDGSKVAKYYEAIDMFAKQFGSSLQAPFMTLSFLALLVIPHLKLGDKGLFDVDKFTPVKLFLNN